MKSRFNPEFPSNGKSNIKPGSNAQKWLHEQLSDLASMSEAEPPIFSHDQAKLKQKLADLSDTQFKLLYAAAAHKEKAERRRIPIEFRPQYEPEYLNQKQVAQRFSISLRTV